MTKVSLGGATIAGGWSPISFDITPEQQGVFEKALTGILGVKYEAIAVQYQVVAGINYRFYAKATVVYPGGHSFLAEISIFQPLGKDAEPILQSIEQLR